jgi:hypothetical protein
MRLWKRTREQMSGEAREVLDAQPPQDNAMGVVLNAWDDLLRCRPMGMGVGLVPWTAAMQWCDRHGLDEDAAQILWTVVKRIDADDHERRNRPAPGKG